MILILDLRMLCIPMYLKGLNAYKFYISICHYRYYLLFEYHLYSASFAIISFLSFIMFLFRFSFGFLDGLIEYRFYLPLNFLTLYFRVIYIKKEHKMPIENRGIFKLFISMPFSMIYSEILRLFYFQLRIYQVKMIKKMISINSYGRNHQSDEAKFDNFNNFYESIIKIIKMSIYSGFATRQQQQAYDNLVLDLISVLQRRIIKFYVGQDADEAKFHTVLTTLQGHLTKMQQSKYLEPKLSHSFRELINLTANIQAQDAQPPRVVTAQQPRKITSAPKQSLNFSTDKIVGQLKNMGFGKIKHQSTSKDEGLSSRGDTNPQNHFDRQAKRSASSCYPKQGLLKKDLQRWGAIYDGEPPNMPQQAQKKNVQYIIREYISRGQKRRQKKKIGFD